MAAFRSISFGFYDGVAVSSFTVNMPAGVAKNDLLIASILRANVPVITQPAGWNAFGNNIPLGAGAGVDQMDCSTRKATASEPASYTWTFSSALTSFRGYICAYSSASPGAMHLDAGAAAGPGASPLNSTVGAHLNFAVQEMIVHYPVGLQFASSSTAITFVNDAATTSRGTDASGDNSDKLSAADETFSLFLTDEPARTHGYTWTGIGSSNRVACGRIVLASNCTQVGGGGWGVVE